MRLLSFCLTSCVALLLQVPVNLIQQQTPKGSIEGTVTRLGSGLPVPNTRVIVTRRPSQATAGQPNPAAGARGTPAAPPIPPVMTDERGRFAVTGLDEGASNVLFQANGYVERGYDRFVSGEGRTPVTVTAGQATREVNVALTPTGNIAGRVHDLSDQPLVNVPVELLQLSYDRTG